MFTMSNMWTRNEETCERKEVIHQPLIGVAVGVHGFTTRLDSETMSGAFSEKLANEERGCVGGVGISNLIIEQ